MTKTPRSSLGCFFVHGRDCPPMTIYSSWCRNIAMLCVICIVSVGLGSVGDHSTGRMSSGSRENTMPSEEVIPPAQPSNMEFLKVKHTISGDEDRMVFVAVWSQGRALQYRQLLVYPCMLLLAATPLSLTDTFEVGLTNFNEPFCQPCVLVSQPSCCEHRD